MSNQPNSSGPESTPTQPARFPHSARSAAAVRGATSRLLALLICSFLGAGLALASDYKTQQKQANEFFKGRSWTAKLPLETNGRYFIDATGQPLDNKKQGRRARHRLGIGQRDIAFPVGAVGRGTYIRVDGSDREVVVVLQKKRGVSMHQARMYIRYSRAIAATDLEPEAIARALSPYVEFEGIAPDREFAQAVSAIDTGAAATPGADRPMIPVSGLEVVAVPSRVTRGQEVVLELTFDIGQGSAATVDVLEARTLSFDGNRLPSFPVERTQARSAGRHTSRYRQLIPASANPGTYSFKGEVCAGNDCVSRIITFEVVP